MRNENLACIGNKQLTFLFHNIPDTVLIQQSQSIPAFTLVDQGSETENGPLKSDFHNRTGNNNKHVIFLTTIYRAPMYLYSGFLQACFYFYLIQRNFSFTPCNTCLIQDICGLKMWMGSRYHQTMFSMNRSGYFKISLYFKIKEMLLQWDYLLEICQNEKYNL